MRYPKINHPKIRMKISPTLVDCETLDHIIKSKYNILYCGIHCVADDIYVFIHNRERMASSVLTKLLFDTLDILEFTKFSFLEGQIVDSAGTVPKHGGSRDHAKRKRAEKSSTINLICVNPIGQESLDGITPGFIKDLLAGHHGPEVVFKFGTKMYSLPQNMNFKTDAKSGFVSGRVSDDKAWVTHRKNEGFLMLLKNLKDKNEEAVQKYVDVIPAEDIDDFNRDMSYISKIGELQENEPLCSKFIRDGFNALAANFADKAKRVERKTGTKLRLV
ncbi:unnamed protein product [Pylaiella littoralis]